MSHVALQRVLVRMLYDPAFARDVYGNPARLATIPELSLAEQRWLVASDPRAFTTDPYRRSRSLAGLLEEYPASSSLVVRSTGSTEALDAFFSSQGFHDGLQHGRSLGLDFGEYLHSIAANDSKDAAPLVALELAMARARRGELAVDPPAPSSTWRLHPHIERVAVPGGTLSTYERLLRHLDTHANGRAAAIIDAGEEARASGAQANTSAAFDTDSGAPSNPAASAPPNLDMEYLLIDAGDEAKAGVRIERLPRALFELLGYAKTARTWDQWLSIVASVEATPKEIRDILDDFTASGELIYRT